VQTRAVFIEDLGWDARRQCFDLGGEPAGVTGILRTALCQTRQLDLLDLLDGKVLYGLNAQSRSGAVLVRWDADKLLCYQGQTLSADEVKSAFGNTPKTVSAF
jgi:hypothetical protein